MYDENLEWVSQKLFRYKDTEFNTNVVLEISCSTSTSDYIMFSPPVINLSMLNSITKNRKNAVLSYNHISDMIYSVDEVLNVEDLFTSNISLLKNATKDKFIKIAFQQTPSKINVVIFGIFYTQEDYVYIILQENLFRSIINIFNNYIKNYINISNNMGLREIQIKNNKELKNIYTAIHSLPSSMNLNNNKKRSDVLINPDLGKDADDSLYREFDEFIGGPDMSNIPVDKIFEETGELLKDKKNITEVNSDLFLKVLDGNISNIESIMDAVSIVENPIQNFQNFIIEKIGMDVKLTPSISDNQFKSASYLSKLIYTIHFQQYTINNKPITSEIHPMLYDELNADEDVLKVAYDLFLLIIYIKLLKDKMVNVVNDNFDNKSILYLSLRCFSDIIVFSNISKVDDNNIIISNLTSRFEYFKNKKFFDDYDNLLKENDLPEITKYDITNFAKVILNTISEFERIEQLVDNYYQMGRIKISNINNFSTEQILNQIIPLEIKEDLYGKLKSKEEIEKVLDSEISDEIVSLFLNDKDINIESKKDKKETPSNIYRFINHYRDQLPEDIREDFLEYVKNNLSETAFDFNNTEYKLEKFGKDIIIALNIWDPENNKLLKKSYKDFYLRIESSCLDVDLFLSSLNANDKDNTENPEDWGINL